MYIRINSKKIIAADSPEGKAHIKAKAEEAKKLKQEKELADQEAYFAEVEKQKAAAKAVLEEFKEQAPKRKTTKK